MHRVAHGVPSSAAVRARFFGWCQPALRQIEAERFIEPDQHRAPRELDEPRREHCQHEGRNGNRASRISQIDEKQGKRPTTAIDIRLRFDATCKQAFEHAARQQYADKADPQPDRAGAAQSAAAREHRFHDAPEERKDPDD